MKTITYHPLVGTHINDAVRKACRKSRVNKCQVTFEFNGIRLFATPKKSSKTILWEWEIVNGQKQETYRQSLKGQEAKLKRAAEIHAKQLAVDDLLRELPGILKDESDDELMNWLKHFTESADDNKVTFDHSLLIRIFENACFKRNDMVGAKDFVWTKRLMCRYIIGQVLDCLYSRMPPHRVIITFIERDYNKLDK